MTQTQIKAIVIESDRPTGIYDMRYVRAIVDHPRHGRLYMQQVYGGEMSLSGGAYRWGIACKVPDGTTLEQATDIHRSALDFGQVLDWENYMVENLADSCGL